MLHRANLRPRSLQHQINLICRCLSVATVLVLMGAGQLTLANEQIQATEANVMAELAFTATNNHYDPFNEVTLDVIFTDPKGDEQRVPAFWAGKNLWKARYASPLVGTHRFRSECSQPQDVGLHGVTGQIEIKPYTGNNPLYAHGPIRVAANRRYMEHADGTPFFWLGDTWWMGLCHRLHWPDEVKELAADRRAKGFNVIQIVAGLYPDMHQFDPRGANEAGFPWEENYTSIRPEYFDAADERLKFLVEEGFTPCIVGAWGYYIPWLGVEKANQHWRYLIARYGALPVVWCAAGEANLPWYLAKGFPYDDRKQVTDWTEVLRYIRATDPFHRPLTIHPTGIGRLSARNATDDPNLIDFDMLQTPHGQRSAVEPTVRTVVESYADKPTMPVINGEAAYEMLGDNLPTKWTRQMFWLCMTNGAAGHTYGANGIWQCNRLGEPHGPSPHHKAGAGYGKIPWNEAMNLPGSTQVALGKKLFERFAWHRFEPHPEWVEPFSAAQTSSPWKEWIWFPEGEPVVDAPAAKRYFRKTFDVHDVSRAALWLAADDKCTAYLNGERVGQSAGWKSPPTFDVTSALREGRNVLAIEAENSPAPSANPAGLLASLLVQTNAGETHEVAQSDNTWRCTQQVDDAPNWTTLAFDDTGWIPAKPLAKHGQPPWGDVTVPPSYGPYAVGIPGEVRVIYAPSSWHELKVLGLEDDVKYRAQAFDPISGKSMDLPDASASGDQRIWAFMNPATKLDDDWVLVLERVP